MFRRYFNSDGTLSSPSGRRQNTKRNRLSTKIVLVKKSSNQSSENQDDRLSSNDAWSIKETEVPCSTPHVTGENCFLSSNVDKLPENCLSGAAELETPDRKLSVSFGASQYGYVASGIPCGQSRRDFRSFFGGPDSTSSRQFILSPCYGSPIKPSCLIAPNEIKTEDPMTPSLPSLDTPSLEYRPQIPSAHPLPHSQLGTDRTQKNDFPGDDQQIRIIDSSRILKTEPESELDEAEVLALSPIPITSTQANHRTKELEFDNLSPLRLSEDDEDVMIIPSDIDHEEADSKHSENGLPELHNKFEKEVNEVIQDLYSLLGYRASLLPTDEDAGLQCQLKIKSVINSEVSDCKRYEFNICLPKEEELDNSCYQENTKTMISSETSSKNNDAPSTKALPEQNEPTSLVKEPLLPNPSQRMRDHLHKEVQPKEEQAANDVQKRKKKKAANESHSVAKKTPNSHKSENTSPLSKEPPSKSDAVPKKKCKKLPEKHKRSSSKLDSKNKSTVKSKQRESPSDEQRKTVKTSSSKPPPIPERSKISKPSETTDDVKKHSSRETTDDQSSHKTLKRPISLDVNSKVSHEKHKKTKRDKLPKGSDENKRNLSNVQESREPESERLVTYEELKCLHDQIHRLTRTVSQLREESRKRSAKRRHSDLHSNHHRAPPRRSFHQHPGTPMANRNAPSGNYPRPHAPHLKSYGPHSDPGLLGTPPIFHNIPPLFPRY